MASFAKIGLNNKVIEVLSVNNDVIKDASGNEVESLGIDFLTKLTGWAMWKQTSYNGNFRKNHAGKGYTYDEDRDAFIPPRHNATHVILDEEGCYWECPYQANQITDNRGIELPYKDTSEYTVNANRNPKEIQNSDFSLLDMLQLNTLLTPGRRNGVYSMLEKIREYAESFSDK